MAFMSGEKIGLTSFAMYRIAYAAAGSLGQLDRVIQRFQTLPTPTRAIYERAARYSLASDSDLGPAIYDFSAAMSVAVATFRAMPRSTTPIETPEQAEAAMRAFSSLPANTPLDAVLARLDYLRPKLRKLLLTLYGNPRLEALLPGWRRAADAKRPQNVTPYQRVMAIALSADARYQIADCEPDAIDRSRDGASLFDAAVELWLEFDFAGSRSIALDCLSEMGRRLELPSYRALIARRHFAPAIYRNAPPDVRAELQRIATDIPEARAASLTPEDYERERQEELAAWRHGLAHLDNDALRATGHRRDEQGQIHALYPSWSAQFVSIDTEAGDDVLMVSPAKAIGQTCGTCGDHLYRVLDLDLRDPRLKPIRELIASQPHAVDSDRIEAVMCLGCTFNGAVQLPEHHEGTAIATFARDKLGKWKTLLPTSGSEQFGDPTDVLNPMGIREMIEDDPREASHGFREQFGGCPRWHNEASYPLCMLCAQPMVVLSSFILGQLYHCHACYCARCRATSVVSQFDA